MLQDYSLSEMLSVPSEYVAYYADKLEAMKEPDVEWPHRQSFYSFVWFTQGDGFNVIDFRVHKLKNGRLFLISPEQINNWNYASNSKGYVLMIDKSAAAQVGIEFSKPYIDIKKREAALLQLVFENLIKDCKSNKEELQPKIMAAIGYFYSLVAAKINSKAFFSFAKKDLFRQFKELVLAGDATIKSTGKYANTLHVSAAVLNTICHDFAGVSAKQLLLDLKITEAKRLLLYSQLNISEIAFQLGFEDTSYFARIFKKKTRLSPTLFQEKYRK